MEHTHILQGKASSVTTAPSPAKPMLPATSHPPQPHNRILQATRTASVLITASPFPRQTGQHTLHAQPSQRTHHPRTLTHRQIYMPRQVSTVQTRRRGATMTKSQEFRQPGSTAPPLPSSSDRGRERSRGGGGGREGGSGTCDTVSSSPGSAFIPRHTRRTVSCAPVQKRSRSPTCSTPGDICTDF